MKTNRTNNENTTPEEAILARMNDNLYTVKIFVFLQFVLALISLAIKFF